MIEPIDIKASIRRNQDRYFGTNGATGSGLASHLASCALELGATSVLVERNEQLWCVWADADWLMRGNIAPASIASLFERMYAFPESGVNCHRPEIEVATFCENIAAMTQVGFDFVQGNIDLFSKLAWKSDYVRVLAFEYAT